MIVNNVIPNKLHQELIDTGIECSIFHNLEDGRYFVGDCEIKFVEGTDMALVQQIIDVHDPTPLPQPPTADEQLEQRLFEAETALLESNVLNKELGTMNFDLETRLIEKGVL